MKPQFFDIHSHVSFSQFDDDRRAVLERMEKEHIFAVTVGVDYASSERAVEMAGKHGFLFATIGQHPSDNRKEEFVLEKYTQMIVHPKVVAVGECGLDYFRIEGSIDQVRKRQIDLFEQQINLALEHGKPLMLHCRPSQGSMNAYEDVLEVLASFAKTHGSKLRGNVHFFVGDVAVAKRFLELDFTLSFTGVLTFARDYDDVVKYAPLDMILSETDCPFVAPVPHRGERNEPLYVVEVVKKIALIRGEKFEKVRVQLVENAMRVFDIK